MIPVSGSAYTYTYATLGEIFAWLIGWDLLLEYAVGASAVAVGWSAYLQNVLKALGMHLPQYLSHAPESVPWQAVCLAAGAITVGVARHVQIACRTDRSRRRQDIRYWSCQRRNSRFRPGQRLERRHPPHFG